MADFDFHGADYGAETPSRLGEALRGFGAANWAGAAVSLTLAGGLAVWAVDLTMRDMSRVPVIAAMEGPMRVAPEDPGGMRAPFQGMALSELTSGGPAGDAPEEVVLAPAPVELEAPALAARRAAAEAGAETLDPVADALTGPTPPPPAIAAPEPADIASLAEPPLPEAAKLPAPEEVAGDEFAFMSDAVSAVLAEAMADVEPADRPETVAGPGLASSTRPAQRPHALRRTPTEAPIQQPGTQVASIGGTVVTSQRAAADADPDALAPGTRVVQLGAFDSRDVALGEWERLSGRFAPYMEGKQRLVQKARTGGRDFWRLRVVGFADAADARRFCSALLAKDAACIPVTIR
jgi:hypothetical protein